MFLISPVNAFSFSSSIWALSYCSRRGKSLKQRHYWSALNLRADFLDLLKGKSRLEKQAVWRETSKSQSTTLNTWRGRQVSSHKTQGNDIKEVESPSFWPGWRKASKSRWDVCVLLSYLRSKAPDRRSIFDQGECLKSQRLEPYFTAPSQEGRSGSYRI